MEALASQLIYEDNETARYDNVNVLVVGSGVAHDALKSGKIKWPIENWVNGGGTLIVFGSHEKKTNWMEPLFGIKEESSSGGLSTPDEGHPLLNSPEPLNHHTYLNYGKGWKLKKDSETAFTPVVNEGDVPVTLVNKPGAHGEGNIMVTMWMPYNLSGDRNFDEGLHLMQNFLLMNYRDLYLDYGPPLPQNVPVVPAFRDIRVDHPYIEDDLTLHARIFVFPYYGA